MGIPSTDEIMAKEFRWEATARAYIATQRAIIKREATESERVYGEVDRTAYDLGQVFRELRRAVIEDEMKTATDSGASKDLEAVRQRVDRLIYFRAVQILLKEENK